ncbi:DUF397 domain-containing protein [Streptomyces synnematoformans]|uniref:DUF397 domain-containing protein n=2 Tax=Streptomyces synnematoformans TaxID=415721 RepID=A0ABP5K5U1_9ACTN
MVAGGEFPECGEECGRVQQFDNGVMASSIPDVRWTRSARSGVEGNCVEVALLPGGGAAFRNSRDPKGPALVYTRDEVIAFLGGAKGGEFDFLLS